MSTKRIPLDPSRWSIDGAKINVKDIPDPPGYGFRKERDESSVSSRNDSASKGILEKV